ncbi:N-acetylmuramic acid 6-phosphate etherase [compost metagenome]
MVLNMISTAAMIGIGKVYSNLMVDVQPTNEKLVLRAKSIISEITGCDMDTASIYYERSHHQVKVAAVMLLAGLGLEEAQQRLQETGGFIRQAVQHHKGE